MSAADLARLELAKRAYRAAQPSENEIQTGVRRTRLALGRPKPRRAWFTKGVVFVVLAVGSLAYAKPHALGELVEKALARDDAKAARPGLGAAAVRLPPEPTTKPQGPGATRADTALPNPIAHTTTPGADTTGVGVAASNGASPAKADNTAASSRSPAATSKPLEATAKATTAARKTPLAAAPAAAATATAADGDAHDAAVSNWGRVGQALARGDEAQALSALGELSKSDDRRTRDKADLGRAQLLFAHGDSDRACALARALTNRRADSRIERQAQALLKTCSR